MKKAKKGDRLTWHLYELHAEGTTAKPCACASERQPGFGAQLGIYNSKAECEKAKKARHRQGG